MKSDEEFIADVYGKADAVVNRKRKINRTLLSTGAAVFAMALIITAVSGNANRNHVMPPAVETSEDTNIAEKGFMLLADCAYNTSAKIKSTDSVSDIALPAGGILEVKDTSLMSERETSEISYELKMKLQELYGTDIDWHISGRTDEKASVLFATADKLRVMLPENSDAAEIIISCTENGNIMLYNDSNLSIADFRDTVRSGNNIVITAEEYEKIKTPEKGMAINWQLSEKLTDKLSENPETDLSTVSDAVSITVNYKDGTSESVTVVMLFDDSGNLHTFFSGSVSPDKNM